MSDDSSKPDSASKESAKTENNQNLSSLLSAASPSALSLPIIPPSMPMSSSASMTMSSMLNTTAKAEVKTEASSEVKPEVEVKEEKMEEVKSEVEVKPEPASVKTETDSSSPKIEAMDENSQASTNEDSKTEAIGDSSNNATPKPRCKKGRVLFVSIVLCLFILKLLY